MLFSRLVADAGRAREAPASDPRGEVAERPKAAVHPSALEPVRSVPGMTSVGATSVSFSWPSEESSEPSH